MLTGLITAAAGWLAMETAPAHTAEAHKMMQCYMYTQLASVGGFPIATVVRWRHWDGQPG